MRLQASVNYGRKDISIKAIYLYKLFAQLPEHATADQPFTSDYAYFSSTQVPGAYSKSLVEKAIRN